MLGADIHTLSLDITLTPCSCFRPQALPFAAAGYGRHKNGESWAAAGAPATREADAQPVIGEVLGLRTVSEEAAGQDHADDGGVVRGNSKVPSALPTARRGPNDPYTSP